MTRGNIDFIRIILRRNGFRLLHVSVDVYKSARQKKRVTLRKASSCQFKWFSGNAFIGSYYRTDPQLSDLFLPSPSLSFTTWDWVSTTSAAMSLIRGLVSTLYHIPKIYKWFYRPYYLLSLLMTLAFPLVRNCPGLCENLPSQREDADSCAFDWVSAAHTNSPGKRSYELFYYNLTLLQLNNTLYLQ